MPDTPEQVPVRVLGGPTTLIGYGGLRVLTDPTFDAPGEYPLGGGRVLTKTAPSAVDPGGGQGSGCGDGHQAVSSRLRLVRHCTMVKISVRKKITTPIAAP